RISRGSSGAGGGRESRGCTNTGAACDGSESRKNFYSGRPGATRLGARNWLYRAPGVHPYGEGCLRSASASLRDYRAGIRLSPGPGTLAPPGQWTDNSFSADSYTHFEQGIQQIVK